MDTFELPEYLESFLCAEETLLNNLLNDTFGSDIQAYLESNPALSEYTKRLSQALEHLVQETQQQMLKNPALNTKKVMRIFIDINRKCVKKRIDADNLYDHLHESNSSTADAFIQLIKEGMNTWHLPLLSNLNQLVDNNGNTIIQVLTWIEKRRDFLQLFIKKDPILLHWLMGEKQIEDLEIIKSFTDNMFCLLTEEIDLEIEDEDDQVEIAIVEEELGLVIREKEYIRTPRIMDVRALWHTLETSKEIYHYDNHSNSQLLIQTTREILFSDPYKSRYFDSISVSPWTCFLEGINGPSASWAYLESFKGTKDILMWLLLTQVENTSLAPAIMKRILGVERVFESYSTYLKSQSLSPLAKSMTNLLHSPTVNKKVSQNSPSEGEEPATKKPKLEDVESLSAELNSKHS